MVLDPSRFSALPNLTHLSLARNRLHNLPVEAITAMATNLTELDASDNSIGQYPPELSDMVRGGLRLRLKGNPLECNCFLRPIAYWLTSVGRVRGRGAEWDKAECAAPPYLSGSPVGALIEEQLICEDSDEAQQFRLNPDVRFRQVDEKGDRVEFSWFVNTNEDVGDFHLELRTRTFPQTTLFERDISYDTRHVNGTQLSFDLLSVHRTNSTVMPNRYQILDKLPGGEELNLCLLVKSSAGRIRRWRQDQCHKVGPFSGVDLGVVPGAVTATIPMLTVLIAGFFSQWLSQ